MSGLRVILTKQWGRDGCTGVTKDGLFSLDIKEKHKATELFYESFYNAKDMYKQDGDPIKCCDNVENILCEPYASRDSQVDFKLSPLHHLSSNGFVTLTSIYKLLANSKTEEGKLDSFDLTKTSVAYTLLIAGITHHLLISEPSFIVYATNLWIDAGNSLLDLERSWNLVEKRTNLDDNLQCSSCSLKNLRE